MPLIIDPFPDPDGFLIEPWFDLLNGIGRPRIVDLTPETVDVNRTPDPIVYSAQALAVAPESLIYAATAADLGRDPTTVTSVAFFVRRPDGTTSQWSATSSADTNQITATHEYVDGDLPQAESLRICAVYGFGSGGNTLQDGGNTLTDGSGNPLIDGAAGGVVRSRGFTLIVLD